ncbi:LysR family transcriptional regulator [Burkholderiaceae bacterium FT117]|uniref:LysR family transcriptional regulator n=1 Tax=Zeimonas sediminis TaxID=2944268 RepID=UPI002342D3F5|nr:LysR family transcriptional regulator [Zeimonas sediminis]MCM5571104.1 LysR family transcriptional regulator [Zeimonas sediminis]
MHLSIRQMQAFRTVAEAGSFSEAAERLHLSQPALSAAIRKLEETLGVRLFDRTTRRIALTPEGQELLRLSARLIDEFEAVTGDLSDYLARRRGRVVVAALPSLAAITLPPALARLKAAHPGIDVAIRDTLHDEIQEMVRSGAADFGLTVAPAPGSGLAFRPLIVDRFVLVCPPGHELAGRRQVSWAQVVRYPIVGMAKTSSVRQHIDAACAQAGIELRNEYDAEHLATVGALVREGLGVAALPSLTTPLLRFAGLAEVPIVRPRVERTMGILTRAGRSASVAASALVEMLIGGAFGQGAPAAGARPNPRAAQPRSR